MKFGDADLQKLIRDIAFQSGFMRLDQAYTASVVEPTDAQAEAEAAVRARYRIPAGHPLPPMELDEHGDPLMDFHDEIYQIAEQITSTHQILLEAFMIALFHFWEKEANKWLRVKKYIHKDVMAWLKVQGAAPDEISLRELQLIVNALKHGPGDSADNLFSAAPNLFDPNERSKPGFVPSNTNLVLTKAMLDRYFGAVRASA